MKTLFQFKIASILMISLGIIHVCATPIVFRLFKGNDQVDLASIYMFVMVGVSVIFVGWLQYYILKSNNFSLVLLRIMETSVLFFLIYGIGAVATMWKNPFAYICLMVAFYEVFQLKLYSHDLNAYFNIHEKE